MPYAPCRVDPQCRSRRERGEARVSQSMTGVRPVSRGPAAGDVVAGGVFDGGEGPLGAGAAGVGCAVFPVMSGRGGLIVRWFPLVISDVTG
jgi:hypothetical protein